MAVPAPAPVPHLLVPKSTRRLLKYGGLLKLAQQASWDVDLGRRHMEKDTFRHSVLPSYRRRIAQPGLIPWLLEGIPAYRGLGNASLDCGNRLSWILPKCDGVFRRAVELRPVHDTVAICKSLNKFENLIHATQRKHCTPVQRLARRGEGASGARINAVLISPALSFLKRAKNPKLAAPLIIILTPALSERRTLRHECAALFSTTRTDSACGMMMRVVCKCRVGQVRDTFRHNDIEILNPRTSTSALKTVQKEMSVLPEESILRAAKFSETHTEKREAPQQLSVALTLLLCAGTLSPDVLPGPTKPPLLGDKHHLTTTPKLDADYLDLDPVTLIELENQNSRTKYICVSKCNTLQTTTPILDTVLNVVLIVIAVLSAILIVIAVLSVVLSAVLNVVLIVVVVLSAVLISIPVLTALLSTMCVSQCLELQQAPNTLRYMSMCNMNSVQNNAVPPQTLTMLSNWSSREKDSSYRLPSRVDFHFLNICENSVAQSTLTTTRGSGNSVEAHGRCQECARLNSLPVVATRQHSATPGVPRASLQYNSALGSGQTFSTPTEPARRCSHTTKMNWEYIGLPYDPDDCGAATCIIANWLSPGSFCNRPLLAPQFHATWLTILPRNRHNCSAVWRGWIKLSPTLSGQFTSGARHSWKLCLIAGRHLAVAHMFFAAHIVFLIMPVSKWARTTGVAKRSLMRRVPQSVVALHCYVIQGLGVKVIVTVFQYDRWVMSTKMASAYQDDPVSLLAFNQLEAGLIPGRVTPGFSHVGIVLDGVTGRRVYSGISRFSFPFFPAQLHTHLNSAHQFSRPRGFLGDIPPPTPLPCGAAPYSPRFALIDSHDLDYIGPLRERGSSARISRALWKVVARLFGLRGVVSSALAASAGRVSVIRKRRLATAPPASRLERQLALHVRRDTTRRPAPLGFITH
ncbi:hypothetical protein PR048_011848 [Dryococelus australis]|uniref:Uncharacterized protein n=1 Tax=Dryococelus australis TaxID=614101 RepID=A0ABQ9HMY2_9NEOP|nr:hypothetical protein PR048_011848 [Dryococelus australis]